MSAQIGDRNGGFGLAGLLVGLAAGVLAYGIIEFWSDRSPEETVPATVLIFLGSVASSLLLLAERGRFARAAPPALLIGAALAVPGYFMMRAANMDSGLDQFAPLFWFLIGAPLAGFLMTTLAKAALADGGAPRYPTLFFHGLTLPVIYAGAGLFTALSLVLLFAWAALLRSMDVNVFHKLFQEPWFMLPFAGAVGGLSIGMMRSFDAAVGALRFFLLLFCRIAMPITAAFSLTFVLVLLTRGPGAIYALPLPGHLMLALALAGMLIFNGVYQNGEGGPPPLWLRIATIISLAAFPVYAGLAASVVWNRASEFGLTPARIFGLAANSLAALYSIVCIAGLATELRFGAKRWMPLVAPLNIVMALVWVVVLIALATPLVDPWALSARDQEQRLMSGRVSVDAFDFAYLKAGLGKPGAAALERLAATPDSHPEAAAIREAATRALADQPFILEPETGATPIDESAAPARPPSGDTPDSLPLNPASVDTGDDPRQGPSDPS